MANFKDIFAGTIGKAVNKVKEVADSGAVRDLYEQGSDKVKSYGRIAKLNLEISGHNEELKRLYTEIGKQYYEQAKGCPEGFFASLFAQVDDLVEEVTEKEAEIAALKEGFAKADPDIDVEFEEVVDGCCCTSCCCEEDGTCTCTCDDGSTCTCTCDENGVCTCDDGRTCTCTCDESDFCDKVEDFVEKVCDKAECICDKVEEKIECVCDKIEEKVECCCDKAEEKTDCCCNNTDDCQC